jgi:hypothetical protein
MKMPHRLREKWCEEISKINQTISKEINEE